MGGTTDPLAGIGTSVGNPPPPPAAPSSSDPLANLGTPVTPATAPAPPAATGDLTQNPKGEGTYAMVDNGGQTLQIPYSRVQTAASQGARFQTKQALQQYARDHAADPVSEDAADRYIDGLSWYNPVKMGRDVVAGLGIGALKTATGLDRVPKGHGVGGEIEQNAQLAAATPTKGVAQGAGELAENVGEWFSGEELLGMLGKTGEAMGLADKLKSVTNLAQMIEKYPMVGKLLKIGSSAVKQGTIGAAQTYAKSGGNAGAAGEAGALTAAITPLAEGITSRLARPVAAPAAVPGAEDYAAQARAAVEPHLRAISQAIDDQAARAGAANPEGVAPATSGTAPAAGTAANATATPVPPVAPHYPHTAADLIENSTPTLPGGGDTDLAQRNQVGPTRAQGSVEFDDGRGLPGSEGRPALPGGGAGATAASAAAATAAARATGSFNVDDVLNTIHDFNGAKDRLVQVASPMYDAIDQVTGGQFRRLNSEVAAAQKAVYKTTAGTPERDAAEKLYDNRQAEMSDLIDSTKGVVSPQIVGAAKQAFRQSYLLDDFATMWDRNLEGVPGKTKVSAAQRGVNGKGLMRDLVNTVNKKGRPFVESVLGPERLDNLEEIARANETIPKKIAFTDAVRNVARNMAHGAIVGGAAGEMLGAGYHLGAATGAGAIASTYLPDVMRAVWANPKIGQMLTFAIKNGARPETYGPMIAKMIQATNDDQQQKGQQ